MPLLATPPSPFVPGQLPATADPLLGQILGNFRIVRQLGSGGMGTVYLGEHLVIGSKVAVKMLHPHLSSDPALVQRLLGEAKAVNLAGHENIVSIFDLNRLPPDRYYLIMEYLEGRPLSAMLGRPIELEVTLPILLQICDALEAAHAVGIIHRDLKPENVFLTRRQGSEHFVKVLDFGIAKLFQVNTGATMAGMVVGTPEFMPPEQWSGEAVDGRLDLYALGVVAYVMASGRLPFKGDVLALYRAHLTAPPPSLRPEVPVPESFERAVLRALAKRPEDRFQTARELAAALREVQEELARTAPSKPLAPPPEVPPEPQPRSPSGLPARVAWSAQPKPVEAKALDLSRAGLFLATPIAPPPMFERVRIALQHDRGELELTGEVVRHVTAEQAQAWGMAPGFGVQLAGISVAQRLALDHLARGLPVEQTALHDGSEDPALLQALQGYRQRVAGDHYGILGMASDAECSEIRHRARQAALEIEALTRRLPPRYREELDGLLERVQAAVTVLGTPAWRADYDASRSNFRGVARCLAAGLEISELDGLRQAFLASHPFAEAAARSHTAIAEGLAKSLHLEPALAEYERALKLDPLALDLHQRYWGLKRQLVRTPPRGSPQNRQ
jgi:serine/threonine-protein kinase